LFYEVNGSGDPLMVVRGSQGGQPRL